MDSRYSTKEISVRNIIRQVTSQGDSTIISRVTLCCKKIENKSGGDKDRRIDKEKLETGRKTNRKQADGGKVRDKSVKGGH